MDEIDRLIPEWANAEAGSIRLFGEVGAGKRTKGAIPGKGKSGQRLPETPIVYQRPMTDESIVAQL